MLPTGKVEVITGTSPHGQGHETAWSQIVADRLGVPFDDVEVLHGDTQISLTGLDTYGSRSLAVGGMAVVAAADKVIEKAKPIAAHVLEASVDDLEFGDGQFTVKGTDSQRRASPTSRSAVFSAHDLPDGVEASLDAEATFDPANFSFPHGTHLCAVEVDTETGAVKIRNYICVDDIGKVINPLIVEGQVHGGLAQGIAQALFEEAVYDESGTLVTGSFVDYLVPSAADLPSFTTDRTETPATTNALGVKGVGEAGTIASTPAVVNAIVDAVRQCGINDIEMPCTPHGSGRRSSKPLRLSRRCRMIPAAFDYVAPDVGGRRARGAGLGRRRDQGARRRAEPAPGAAAAAGRADAARRPRPDRRAAGHQRRRRRDRDRRDDDARRGRPATLVAEHAAVLAKAPQTVADPQVRHRGTFGGALVHADPAGDLPAPILALDAELVIAGPGGERTVAAADFFVDLFTTAVGEDEILTADPDPEAHRLGRPLREVHRVAQQWSIVGVAAAVRAEGGTIAEAGSGSPTWGRRRPRVPRSRRRWSGARRRRTRSRRPPRPAADGTNPPTDTNGDADYRRHLATVLTGGRSWPPPADRPRREGPKPVELTHQFTVPAPIDDAWAAFNDLERIAPCFPGAALTSYDGEEFDGLVKVKLGPISLQYTGTGRFVERDEAAHRAVIEAKGKDKRGNGTAAADGDRRARGRRRRARPRSR